jgi:predicted RNase H-like HicB family nuclease
MLKLNYIIEKDSNGYFGYCPEFKGCHTQGESYEETKENLIEAIELYMSTLSSDEITELKNKEYFIESIDLSYA